MKVIILALITNLLALPLLQAVEKPKDLDALLKHVKHERILEQQQNKKREAEFVAVRDNQAMLLAQSEAQLAQQERRATRLNLSFQAQEKKLTKQEALLQEKTGLLGELFGTVRQMANDSRSVLENSMTSVQKSARNEILVTLTENKQQPTITELRNFWLILQEEMTESGKISQFTTPVITAEGVVEEQQVTRVGVFTAFSDGAFFRYIPETGNLVELGRQPVNRLRKLVIDFEQADADSGLQPVVIDPTRGVILALLVQSPDLQERIQQGGWIGYIILGLGVIGLLISLLRFVSLTLISRDIVAQQKNTEVSLKNPLGRILSACSEAHLHDIETLSLKLDEAVLREIPKIERGIVTLAIVAAVAPMLGLLGTVSGMIATFQAIALFGTGDPKLMSGGISQALVTTELGLVVAIPIMFIHSAISSKSNRLVQILDEESAALIAHNAEKKNGITDQ